MKKLITLCMILLPLVTLAQNRLLTIEKFFNNYSDLPGYSSVSVTEDMFKMFENLEEAEEEMIEFLSKLTFVRYLEYNGSVIVTGGTVGVKSGKSTGSSSSVNYVDGKEVDTNISMTTTGKKSSGKSKGTVTNISTLPSSSNSLLYSKAKSEVDFSQFDQLLKSNQNGEKMLLLKREWGADDKEYVLLADNELINIRGDLNIMHIYQLEEILEGIGEIFEF